MQLILRSQLQTVTDRARRWKDDRRATWQINIHNFFLKFHLLPWPNKQNILKKVETTRCLMVKIKPFKRYTTQLFLIVRFFKWPLYFMYLGSTMEKWENAYLILKNARASRDIRQALDQYWLTWLYCTPLKKSQNISRPPAKSCIRYWKTLCWTKPHRRIKNHFFVLLSSSFTSLKLNKSRIYGGWLSVKCTKARRWI